MVGSTSRPRLRTSWPTTSRCSGRQKNSASMVMTSFAEGSGGQCLVAGAAFGDQQRQGPLAQPGLGGQEQPFQISGPIRAGPRGERVVQPGRLAGDDVPVVALGPAARGP